MNRDAVAFQAKSLAGALVLATGVILGATAFYRLTAGHLATSAFHASALWGVLVLASFAGWGMGLNAWLFPRRRADWGLRCAWGWGVATGIGGVLCAAGLAVRWVLQGFVEVGLLLLFVGQALQYLRWRKRSGRHWLRAVRLDAPFLVGVAALAVLGATLYLGAIVEPVFNESDDNAAYLGFVREILDRGTLTQPFSLRRITAYGGQSLLGALQFAVDVPDWHGHLLDSGMATLTVMALIVGHVRSTRWTSRAIVLLAALLTATLMNMRINVASYMTGVVFFLGLYRTLTWRGVMDLRGLRPAVPVALLAAGACSLRQNYLPTVGAFLAIAYGAEIVRGSTLRPFRLARGALVDAGVTAGLLLLLLVPWCILSQQWVGTFLFPILHGNFNRAYGVFEKLELFPLLRYVWANVCYCMPVKAVALFLAAALTLRDREPRKPLVALCLASVVGFAMLIHSDPDSDSANLGRYYFGFTFAAMMAITLATSDLASRIGRRAHRHRELTAVPLVIVALGAQLYEDRFQTFQIFDAMLLHLQPVMEKPAPWAESEQDLPYRVLQDAVPPGWPLVSMVDNLGHFDHGRNRVAALDLVGAVSPDGPLPHAAGADALANYFVSHGYRYAVVVNPATSRKLYRRDVWEDNEKNGADVWKQTAHFYLEAFDTVDELRATRRHLADAAGMSTLDLTVKTR